MLLVYTFNCAGVACFHSAALNISKANHIGHVSYNILMSCICFRRRIFVWTR